MRDIINKYLLDKEILENKEKQRRNYMKDRFKLFKKSDLNEEKDIEYEQNNYEVYENVNNIAKNYNKILSTSGVEKLL